MKDATKHLNGYSPGDAFKEVDPLPPLVEDAASSHTELWLVQLPVNELGPKDLMDKQWTMQPLDPDGKIGHFYSSRGEVYNVVKESVDRKKLYAMMPGSSQHSVRRITSKVCFRRHLEVQPATSLGRTKSGVMTSEAKSRGDSTKSASVQKRALTDEKQTSTVTEGSVGNSEVEKESKKKKKKKEKKSKSEASS